MNKNNILSQTAWWTVNKALTKKIGVDASILLSDLITKQKYFEKDLDNEGYFFNTREKIEEDTTLTPYRQNKAISILKSHKMLVTKNKGVPPKTRFKIDLETVNKILSDIHS